ncbi:hypothetical protein DFP72DRAFT_855265 [Ephemerocybe angulata]|uniref:Uncharacterized protein n=1 Tax=Ephemerocybe angulata TaxID=980116 RepID=A0A8H6HIR9_9AGAR|nr:hypothetical protein DFP72DRAFT_855265 [Tulosesus angulatus]
MPSRSPSASASGLNEDEDDLLPSPSDLDPTSDLYASYVAAYNAALPKPSPPVSARTWRIMVLYQFIIATILDSSHDYSAPANHVRRITVSHPAELTHSQYHLNAHGLLRVRTCISHG